MECWRRRLSLDGRRLGIGIDRLDYTKGIPDRIRALDVLFEECPEYRERLTFAQIGVPSRSGVPAYREVEREVEQLVESVNRRWGTTGWRPITLFKRQFSQPEMIALHRLADFCAVTSLHDGMNLVAKEFVASRTDGDGALVLSLFTGAARELRDAILVNPFSIEETASAYQQALEMPSEERMRRMHRLREDVETNNIYAWAGRFLTALTRLEFPDRMENAESVETEE
jgi:trehalose 6-phosphate synthase